MTGLLHEKEFSRKSFLKGGGAVVAGLAVAPAASAATGNTPFGKRGADHREPDDQRAAALDELLTAELLLMQETRHGYLPPFAITEAACLIAVRMRG